MLFIFGCMWYLVVSSVLWIMVKIYSYIWQTEWESVGYLGREKLAFPSTADVLPIIFCISG